MRPLADSPIFALKPLNLLSYAPTWPYAPNITTKRQHFWSSFRWHIQNFFGSGPQKHFLRNQPLIKSFSIYFGRSRLGYRFSPRYLRLDRSILVGSTTLSRAWSQIIWSRIKTKAKSQDLNKMLVSLSILYDFLPYTLLRHHAANIVFLACIISAITTIVDNVSTNVFFLFWLSFKKFIYTIYL